MTRRLLFRRLVVLLEGEPVVPYVPLGIDATVFGPFTGARFKDTAQTR
jgi:hypothetical protein